MRKTIYWGIRGLDTKRLLSGTSLVPPIIQPPSLFGSRDLAVQLDRRLNLGEPTEIIELTITEYS